MGGKKNKVGGKKNKVGGQKNKVGGQKNKVPKHFPLVLEGTKDPQPLVFFVVLGSKIPISSGDLPAIPCDSLRPAWPLKSQNQ